MLPEFLKRPLLSADLQATVIRWFVIALVFFGVMNGVGMQQREFQQFVFYLWVMVIFGVLLRNVWLTGFLWWSILSFSMFKFTVGHVYIQNIFIGCMLYYFTKLAFKKEHTDLFIKAVIWFMVANVCYIVFQLCGFDFIYDNMYNKPMGFMSNPGITGALIVMCLPLFATRSKRHYWLSFALLIPIYLTKGRINWLAAVTVIMFISYFRINKRIWYPILAGIIVLSTIMLVNKPPNDERFQAWKMFLQDASKRPIIGYGLDSFRNVTDSKPHQYAIDSPQYVIENGEKVIKYSYWDNCHNLYIQMAFEFGGIALLLLLGYIRQLVEWFRYAVKEPNTLALAGFIMAFFIISLGHFPAYLVRCMVIVIPIFSLFEINVQE